MSLLNYKFGIIYAVKIFDNRRVYYLEIEHLYFDSVRMKAHGLYFYMQPSILERKCSLVIYLRSTKENAY